MRFGLNRLAADGFTFETEVSAGALRVVLGRSDGVRGDILVADGETRFNARTSETLSIEALVVPTANSEVKVDGSVAFEQLDVDLAIAGASVLGDAKAVEIVGDRLRVFATDGAAAIDLDGLTVHGATLCGTEGRVELGLAQVHVSSLALPMPWGTIQLLDLRAHDVCVIKRPGGVEITAELVEVDTFHDPREDLAASAEGLRVERVVMRTGAAASTLAAARAAVGRTRLRATWPVTGNGREKRAEEPSERMRFYRAFLSLFSGSISADVVTDVRVPIIKKRRANHPIRLDLAQGMVQYKRLEHCLARLEDAVLDFALEGNELSLNKDIPLVPFDRTKLVSWKLSESERFAANDGWIPVARLAEPQVEIEPQRKGRDEGARFIEEISADDIALTLSVRSHPGLELPAGGRLALGGVDGAHATHAVERLHIGGHIIYRPDAAIDPGQIRIDASPIHFAMEAAAIGSRELSATVQIDGADAKIKFDDIVPSAFEVELRGAQLVDVCLDELSSSPATSVRPTRAERSAATA